MICYWISIFESNMMKKECFLDITKQVLEIKKSDKDKL